MRSAATRRAGARSTSSILCRSPSTIMRSGAARAGSGALRPAPLPSPWRTWIPREQEERAVRVVKAVREAVGPRVDILIDQHRRLAPMHAIRLDRRLPELGLDRMETPELAGKAAG